MEKYLQDHANQEKNMKMKEMEQLKKNWEQNLISKEERENLNKQQKSQFENTSLLGAQVMKGEDFERNDRIKFQRQQMREWIERKIQENEELREQNKTAARREHDLQQLITHFLDRNEKEDAEFKRSQREQIVLENKQV